MWNDFEKRFAITASVWNIIIIFVQNLEFFRANNLYGYLKRNGQKAIKPSYDVAFPFENGYACVGKNINGETKYGCINTDGVLVIPFQYDEYFFFENGIALVLQGEKYD